MSKVIGINLGTTYSAVAYLNGETPEIIPDRDGNRTMPSIVTFLEDTMLAGHAAKNAELTHPENTIRKIKRKMGTDYKVSFFNKSYSPEEISAVILRKLKAQAEEFLGEKIADAIVTVPAYFNDNQRQATKNAGRLAGLNVIRIINEPTAASLAYGVREGDDLNVVIYDLGGGTFDVSILNIGDGIFEVISTAGDNRLGGEDFNKRILDVILNKFRDETNIDLSSDPLAMAKLSEAVEQAKIELSDKKTAKIVLPFITADEHGTKDIRFEISRREFEQMISDYVQRSIELCRQAIGDCGMDIYDIDRVILVGGSSRIPCVRESVAKFFGKEPDTGINPDEVVARGAALQGGIVHGDVSGMVLVDVTPMSLGIEVENGYFVPIIERNNPIPTAARRTFTTVGENQKSVEVHIMQGESLYAKNNVSLGKFRLEGIRTAPKGEPRIEVNFELDVNGILNVSAADLDTKITQGITIIEQGRLSEEELKRLQEEHSNKYDEEIRKRGALNNVLIMKTRADGIRTRIDHTIPPAYQSAMIREELTEIMAQVGEGVQNFEADKVERAIGRLEFIHHEITAGMNAALTADNGANA